LYPLAVDGTVTDVLAIGDMGTWVDRGSGLTRSAILLPEDRLRALATRLVALGGRHVDETTPFADVDLGDGVRVHAVLAPVCTAGTALSIRLPRVRRLDLDDLAELGFFDGRIPRSFVGRLVAERKNVLVSGATGSGKTTLLGAMLAAADPAERIITIEDVAELRVDHPHVVGLQARQANAEGTGSIDLARLVRESLRMRPDRLVVGECRGAEIRDLMVALNTGHRGGAGTVHANSIEDVPARLEALGALCGLDALALARQACSAFDVVLHVGRSSGTRQLEAIGFLGVDDAGRLTVVADDAK
jgi:pilus assembly protein CpaF